MSPLSIFFGSMLSIQQYYHFLVHSQQILQYGNMQTMLPWVWENIFKYQQNIGKYTIAQKC